MYSLQLESALSRPPFELNSIALETVSQRVDKKSLLIRAGAGAGKTTTLIRTFIELCAEFEISSNRLPRVAITTFTRKATQEVKERLSVKALEIKNEKLFQHINKKSSVHISTIHGLLTLFIQDNADILGLPQNIKIIDQNANKKYLKKWLRNSFRNDPTYVEILEHFSFVKAVEFVLLTIEALKQNPTLRYLNAVELKSFTLKKLEQAQQQLEEILQHQVVIPETWLEYFSFLSGLKKLISQQNLKGIAEAIDEKPSKPRWNKKKLAFPQEIHDLIENFWETFDISVIDSEDYFQQHEFLNSKFLKLSHEIFHQDQQRKATSGEITINDLELFSLELVRNHPKAAEDFANNFDYYMIDEFQDTSPIQIEILDALIKHKPHFIVGDPQQSIYLFRGARSEVFQAKEQIANHQDSSIQLQFLDINYRSQPSLMLFINDYFSHMSHQFKPMKTNPSLDNTKSEIHFVSAENEALGALQQISTLLKQNISPKDICVLSRRNTNLVKLSTLAQKFNIPVQLQISAGFDQKREIIDLIAMLRFLVNPHDNENLILLLRSPWAYLSDLEIAGASGKDRSLWFTLINKSLASVALRRLQDYFINYQKMGVSAALMELIKSCRFLDLSAVFDSSGKREANFWKFYTHLKNAESSAGFSLGHYLSDHFQFLQSDLGSSQSEAIPVAQPDRISLMTIHASKGLEFPYVLVLGCAEAPLLTLQMPLAIDLPSNKFSLAPYIISESKTTISRWALKLRRDFNIKESEEHERLLYVAMTRAKKGLVLVAEDKNRNLAASWKSKSIWPEPGSHEHENYRLISVAQGPTDLPSHANKTVSQTLIKEKLKFKTYTSDHQSVTESLTPIAAVENEHINFENKIRDILKAKKGTDMHRLFESLQGYAMQPDRLTEFQKNLTVEEKKSTQYLLNLKSIPLKELIQSGHAEWGFGIKTKNGVLQGQIDLWGQSQDEIYILDYKTGSTSYADKAFQQLTFYGFCLYRMNLIDKKQKLNLVVTYPLEEKTLVKNFSSFNDFELQVPLGVKDLFGL